MRRILLITLAVIVGAFSLLSAYVMWDYDPDNVSPTVEARSYMAIFEDAVRERMRSGFAELDQKKKSRVLTEIIAAKSAAAPAKEVALYKLRELADKEEALAIVKKHLEGLADPHYEVAIGSLAALGTPKAQAWLDTLHRRLSADPAAHTPLGDYRHSSIVLTRAQPDMTIEFRERSRNEADYTTARTREIALFFPANPEYLVSLPNVDDVLAEFDESRFMKTIDGSPVPQDAWSLPMLRTLASLRGRLNETMGFLAPYFSPERFFRDEMILAKYGEAYLIASFKDKNVEVAETLLDIFGKLGRDFGIRKWDVEGVTIASVENRKSGRTLNYAVDNDYFLVSTDSALITRAVRTFHADRGGSIAIDPIFNSSYAAIDPSGARQILFTWMNPTSYFEITGSASPAARRLAMVSRALGRPTMNTEASAAADMAAAAFPGSIAHTTISGEDPTLLWRYIVNVRSLGKNPIDSLARLAKMDIGKQIMPYLSPSMALGYSGVEHLRYPYGFSHTGFNLLAAVPLRTAPARFDSTLRLFFGRITSLVYTPETQGSLRLWMASDTTTNDTALLARKLQPSFTVMNGANGQGILLIASKPDLLRSAVASQQTSPAASGNGGGYFQGRISVDSFAVNAANYLTGYLRRTDRYTPQEIDTRIQPLRNALALYDRIEWRFTEENGLRRGDGKLIGKR